MALPRWLGDPRVQTGIATGIAVLSWAAIAWGLTEPGVAEATEITPGGAAIGLGLAPAIVVTLMLPAYYKTLAKIRAARRGEGVLARWRVTPAELATFRANDAYRNGRGKEFLSLYTPPAEGAEAAEGLEVIFTPDAVLIGRDYYPLIRMGYFQMTAVQVVPFEMPCLEFGVVKIYPMSSAFRHWHVLLRVPSPPGVDDQLELVRDHFRQVLRREIVVDPNFYGRRVRWGLIAAPVFFVIAAIGRMITPPPKGRFDNDLYLGTAMEIAGIGFGFGALLIALVAWGLHRSRTR